MSVDRPTNRACDRSGKRSGAIRESGERERSGEQAELSAQRPLGTSVVDPCTVALSEARFGNHTI